MAKYRLIRKSNGTYDLSGSLTEGRSMFFLKTFTGVPKGQVGSQARLLAEAVQVARQKRKVTRIDARVRGGTG